jgi:hypothetical protein
VPLGFFPADRVPSIHRFPNRAHSVLTPTHISIFQAIVSASAYPTAFPRAFASQTIPLPGGLRLTPTPRCGEPPVRFSVPEPRLALHLGSHSSPGYLRNASRIRNKALRPFTLSILDPADNPRRLVQTDDDSDVSSFSYPYATLLDGIPRWVQSYRLSFPLHGLMVSLYRGESASPLHLRDRNLTCTKAQVIKDLAVFVLHP